MAPQQSRKRFALDANILYDLADELDAAHSLREVLQERGGVLEVPPTVIQELTHAFNTKGPPDCDRALRALQKMRSWGIQPFNLKPVGHGITAAFCNRLHLRGLLPVDEANDGFILAETALAEIPILISRDADLLDIEAQELVAELQASDLAPVHVMHPRTVLKAYKP